MLLNILLFPFRLLFMIAGFILSMCGKLITFLIGLFLLAAGLICCFSIVGLFLGIPLVCIGFATMLKGIF